jgi:internalin A
LPTIWVSGDSDVINDYSALLSLIFKKLPLKIKSNKYIPVMKNIFTLLGIIISSVSVLPVFPAAGQAVNTKSFTQWCQNKLSVPVETRKTINLLLKKTATNNCQIANSKLRKLRTLSLNENKISDVKPLASLTNLESLNLYSNKISDIKPLASLTNLTYLSLSKNQISDVKPLASLTNLIYLLLHNNEISDVKPLASLTNLKTLVLYNNKISDVKPLASLTNLTYLLLHNNEISDVKPLASLTNLENLVLYNNKIIEKICPVKPASICLL